MIHLGQDIPQSGYAYVASQIAALIDRFNLHTSALQIMQTYALICRESLALPPDSLPPEHSRINADGTPLQYAVTLGSPLPTLQFLGEAGGPGINGIERLRVNRECIAAVAQQFHATTALTSVTPLLDALAPEADVDLLADPGGAYWIGAAFSAGREPHLRIYINDRWGNKPDRWTRLSWFAAHFDGSQSWREIATRLAPSLQPLGTAITLHGNHPPAGRIYLSAYGQRMPFYEGLAEVYGGKAFMNQLRAFGRCMLGDDYGYPTQTAVCSFNFGESPAPDFKFELCAHCLFASDTQAVSRLHAWFEGARLNASGYEDMLAILSEGYLSDKTLDLHCYVGVGLRQGAPYATIYLKPRFNAPWPQ
jgi:hypothetical protein